MNKITRITIFGIIIILGGVLLWQTSLHNSDLRHQTNVSVTDSSTKSDANIVEVFYLPHDPVQPIRTKIAEVVKKFPEYTLKEYNFDDDANKQKIANYNLADHTPVAIFIGGADTFLVEGKEISFTNFPKGDAFVPSFEGSWGYDDLERVLADQTKYKVK